MTREHKTPVMPVLARDFDDAAEGESFGNTRADMPRGQRWQDLEIDPGDEPRPLDFGE